MDSLNSGSIYLICGIIIAVIAVICVIFIFRAWRAGKALGMDPVRMRRAVTSSATFSILPSVGILLGVVALSGSLGTPWPWLRLSVIGALHYETSVADAAAEQLNIRLGEDPMTASAFATIALLMSICIMWGMILNLFLNKKYTNRLSKNSSSGSSFGDQAMTAMFIGLVSVYIGSYLGKWISGNGRFTFAGSVLPLLTALCAAAVMAILTHLAEKLKAKWLEDFSLALSMLAGMACAALLNTVVK